MDCTSNLFHMKSNALNIHSTFNYELSHEEFPIGIKLFTNFIAFEEYFPFDDDISELSDFCDETMAFIVAELDIEISKYSFSSIILIIDHVALSFSIFQSKSFTNLSSEPDDRNHLNDHIGKKSKLFNFICWQWKSKRHFYKNLVDISKQSNLQNDRPIFNRDDSVKRKVSKDSYSMNSKGLNNYFHRIPFKILSRKKDLPLKETIKMEETIMIQKLKMDFRIEKENANLLFVAPKSPSRYLLGPVQLEDKLKKCCVIDLDETLVHSSFKELVKYDFKINVEIEGIYHDIFVLKRPYVDLFLSKVNKLFECVLFTASLGKYANPVADLLDSYDAFRWRLFRESCIFFKGGFVKDLSMLGRTLDQTVIIDNSPISFMFHPQNAIQITSWFDDFKDRALLDLIPYLQKLSQSPSVINFLRSELPPLSVTWPSAIPQKISSQAAISTIYSSNINIFGPNLRNNPISSINPNEGFPYKKTNSVSNTSLKRSVLQNIPFRNLFSRTFGNSSSDNKVSVQTRESNSTISKIIPNSSTDQSRELTFNLDKPAMLKNSNPNQMGPTSSGITFGKVIKQNLNSASEVFSPNYHYLKHRNIYLSQNSLRDYSNPNGVVRHLFKRNRKHSRY